MTAILQRTISAGVRAHLSNLLTQQVEPLLSSDDLTFLAELVRKADGKAETIQQEEQRILANRDMSDLGKAKALAEMAERALADFGFLGVVLSRTEQEIADLERRLYAPFFAPKDENPTMRLIRELRAGEIRSAHEGGNHAALFIQALERDDLETTLAFLTAPGGRWVNDDVIQRGKLAYAKRTNETGYAKGQSLARLREHLTGIAVFIAKWLTGLGANPDKVHQTLSL